MAHQLGVKQSNPVITAILVFVVFWAFVFSIAEISHDTEFDGNKSHSNGIFIPLNHTIDWLAEETTVYRTSRVSSNTLRNRILCTLISAEIYSGIESLKGSSMYIKSNNISKSKDTIPISLRI